MTQELDYRDNGDLAFNGEVVGTWSQDDNRAANSATVKSEKFYDYHTRKELTDAVLKFLVDGYLPPERERRTRYL